MRTDDIFQDYGKLVYRYLLRLCGDKDLAEELMQETFYQAVKSADRFDGSCKVSTWLCQIAKHMWYRELRKKKTRYRAACGYGAYGRFRCGTGFSSESFRPCGSETGTQAAGV